MEGSTIVSSQQTERLVGTIEEHSPPEAKVAVLGLAFKPGTHVTEESVGLNLIRLLLNRGREVIAWDPMVTKTGISAELDEAIVAESLEDCVKDADVIVITIPCEEFRNLLIRTEKDTVVIDPWGVIHWQDQRCTHIRPGICQKESEQ